MDMLPKSESEISNNDTRDVIVDLNLFGLAAIKKACYKFTSECSIQIQGLSEDKVTVIFTFPFDLSSKAKEKLINDFHNEMLDQDLREIIFKETEPTRNLILAQAFSKTSLLETE